MRFFAREFMEGWSIVDGLTNEGVALVSDTHWRDKILELLNKEYAR